ncbi:SRPBCC family protein [Mesorhizobium sp. M0618]|uniref:SRPBCC family protein n=1 Tax=unclassified Mesorhizobium TaxID=325217 RepID=UPI00333DAD4D
MAESRFVYVTYMRVSPEKLWEALTTTEFMKSYFFGVTFETEWKGGASWRMIYPDGTVCDSGEILEFSPPSRLELSWRNEWRPEMKAEGESRCVMEIEAAGEAAKLTVTHSIGVENSKLIAGVSDGWPRILSNLKSLLETGATILTR